MRTPILVVTLALLTLPYASVTALSPDALVVPVGETRTLDAPLFVAGDLVVEGALVATGDLVLEATGDIVVRGILRAAHGAVGMPGGNVALSTGGAIEIAQGARVEGGAGGHGAPAIVPGGIATGMDGGAGGDVVFLAARVTNAGVVAPGAGGSGGDAFGRIATGGAGGAMGLFLVNGAPSAFSTLSIQSAPRTAVGCGVIIPVVETPNATVTGADGGDACAQGPDGIDGIDARNGHTDDSVDLWHEDNFPDCVPTAPGNPPVPPSATINSEHGPDGLPGTPGIAAVATGGAGGPGAGNVWAGDGGDAVAYGGAGGDGGDGGDAGDFGYWGGQGCDGGDGISGMPGGTATATGGQQGLHPLNCALNGADGVPTATGGPGGAGGDRGDKGGSPIGIPDGAYGAYGESGAVGEDIENFPVHMNCLPPKAAITTMAHPLVCDRVTISFATLPATPPSVAAQTDYYVLGRGTTPSSMTLVAIVPPGTPLTQYQDNGLTPGVTYYYRAVAWAANGPGPASAPRAATPGCIGGFNPGAISLPPLVATPPLLSAAYVPSVPVGLVQLTIGEPAVVDGDGIGDQYEILRAADGSTVYEHAGWLSFTGGTQTWNDPTTFFGPTVLTYIVRLVTENGPSPDSLPAGVVVPGLAWQGGGGAGSETDRDADGAVTRIETCSLIPAAIKGESDGKRFRFEVRYAPGVATPSDSPTTCALAGEHSVVYSNLDAPPTGCAPDRLTMKAKELYVTRSCSDKGRSLTSTLILRDGSFEEHVVERRADGRSHAWDARAGLDVASPLT